MRRFLNTSLPKSFEKPIRCFHKQQLAIVYFSDLSCACKKKKVTFCIMCVAKHERLAAVMVCGAKHSARFTQLSVL